MGTLASRVLLHPRVSLAALVLVASSGVSLADESPYQLEVDFREAPRNLVTAKLEIPAKPGRLVLRYPKWVRGTHSPFGPVRNLAGLRIRNDAGEDVLYKRESADLYRFVLDVPPKTTKLKIDIRYIANQPPSGLEGADAIANGELGYLNWNTCVLYPEDQDVSEIQVLPAVILPDGWEARSVLKANGEKKGRVQYAAVSLRQLNDSPVAMGKYVATTTLTKSDDPVPCYLHVCAPTSGLLRIPSRYLIACKKLVREARKLFGRQPFDEYHFLLVIDDRLEASGLEHSRTSLNVVETRDMFNSTRRVGWTSELLPHEFVHAWCGKFRRPIGMCQKDYHSDKRLNLLWVYEGLTEYLGCVLTTRCGFMKHQEFLDVFADRLNDLRNQRGRRRQSLEDVAVSSYLLRDSSDHWSYERRDQDYYDEGMLYWLEADATIRKLTKGEKSLDDFCRLFLGASHDAPIYPFSEKDLYAALSSVAEHDWKSFFDERVKRPRATLNLGGVQKVGYQLEYVSSPTKYQRSMEVNNDYLDETAGLGLLLRDNGEISSIVPESPADVAKLVEGEYIAFVEGDVFSETTFRRHLLNKKGDATLSLIVRKGKKHRLCELKFDASHRYPRLSRDAENGDDLLKDILSPLSESQ